MTENNQNRYDVILADPPWDFEVWNRDTGSGRSPSAHYKTMTVDEICKLPIKELANDNCALFFWAVWPRIFDAKPVIEAWGFKYVTLAWEWLKVNRSGVGLHIGMGYYTRANPESCLLATRGSMPVALHNERNLIITDEFNNLVDIRYMGNQYTFPGIIDSAILSEIGKHSEKPDEQYRKIERLYPNRRYLELFARRQRAGWDVFGNEVKNSIALPVES